MPNKKTKDTTSAERSKTVMKTRDFLQRLIDPKETARVPKEVREEAEKLLVHFPNYFDLMISHQHIPFVWGGVERPADLVSEWQK